MSKIRRDFLGLYVSAGGHIARPTKPDILDEYSNVKARHIGQTRKAILKTDYGQEFVWKTTGIDLMSYQQYKKHLNNDDFEKAVLILSSDSLAGYEMYPQITNHLKGDTYVDYRKQEVSDNLKWTKDILETINKNKSLVTNKKNNNSKKTPVELILKTKLNF